MGGEGSLGKNGYIICMAESIRCSPETITLLIGYTPIQNKILKTKTPNSLVWLEQCYLCLFFLSQYPLRNRHPRFLTEIRLLWEGAWVLEILIWGAYGAGRGEWCQDGGGKYSLGQCWQTAGPKSNPSFILNMPALELRMAFTFLKVKVSQSCPTLCDPMDYTVHEILQARILEWVAISFSRGSSQPQGLNRSPALQVDSLPLHF